MTIDQPASGPSLSMQAYPGRGGYYALALRGRLIPHEGGTFAEKGEALLNQAGGVRGKQGFSFGALIDIINPLQHIPVISSIYRRITGDELGPVSRVAGGGLFFGVIGLAGSMVNAFLEKTTGQDVGDRVLNAALGKKQEAQPDTQIARSPAAEPGFRGTVTVLPPGNSVPAEPVPMVLPQPAHKSSVSRAGALDPATFDALARTLGTSDPNLKFVTLTRKC